MEECTDSEIIQRSIGLDLIEVLQYKSIGTFQYFQSFKRGRNVYWMNNDIENDRMYGSYTNRRTIFHAVVSFKPMILQESTYLCLSCISLVHGTLVDYLHCSDISMKYQDSNTSVDYMTLENSENEEEYKTLLKYGWKKENENCIENTKILYKCY